jgi:hypothetical protein
MFPIPSPLDVLVAYAIVFLTSVLATIGLLKYIERLKAAVRMERPVC